MNWYDQIAQTLAALDPSIAGERKTGRITVEIHLYMGHVNVFKVKDSDAAPTIAECRVNGYVTAVTSGPSLHAVVDLSPK